VSAVKRTRKLLSLIDKRTLGKTSLLDGKNGNNGSRSDKQKLQSVSKTEREPEAVYLKATGKAISKALSLALYLQSQDDLHVTLKTGTMGAVDDIVKVEESEMKTSRNLPERGATAVGKEDGAGSNESEVVKEGGASEELPESQIRRTSCIEVAVSLKQ